ncbi:cell division protein FtsZ, partial [Bradyrhizobium elkanii]
MALNLTPPDISELKPRITVFGVGGAGGNAVNNMITAGLQGVDFVVANTDAQALTMSKAQRIVQMGTQVTQGLGAGSQPDVGAAAAQEVMDELRDHLTGANMVFVTAGMGGGTGTGAAPVIAKAAREMGILTVGVVTKPFHFEGQRRMRTAEHGIAELHKVVDTLLIIPNQNLFRVANEKTTFADAFAMADQVLYSGVACITDLMVKEGLINLDFADVRAVMREMGKAMMGTGEATGEKRALTAAEAAIANPLIDDSSMKGARGLLISITGGKDLTLFEVDEAATRIREEVDADANIIVGATFDESLDGVIRVSVVATGIEQAAIASRAQAPAAQQSGGSPESRLADLTARLRADNQRMAERAQKLEPPTGVTVAPIAAPPAAPQGRPAVERAALAAIAAAVAPDSAPAAQAPMQPASYGDVTVRPIAQKPSLFPDHEAARAEQHEPMPPETFIPQAAERSPVRAPRMPKFEDLPMPAQAEIRQASGDGEVEHPQKTRLSLL